MELGTIRAYTANIDHTLDLARLTKAVARDRELSIHPRNPLITFQLTGLGQTRYSLIPTNKP